MTESMVEKVARAIWDERENTFPKRVKTTWAGGTGIAKQLTMDLARAAMKAMREPTQHMANAGWSAIAGHADDPQGAAWPIFNAMIDAALDEKEPTDA